MYFSEVINVSVQTYCIVQDQTSKVLAKCCSALCTFEIIITKELRYHTPQGDYYTKMNGVSELPTYLLENPNDAIQHSDWPYIYVTQSRVLQPDWMILDANNVKTTSHIRMRYWE